MRPAVPTPHSMEPGVARVDAWTSLPITILALLAIPALVLEQSDDLLWYTVGRWLNWIIWLAFAGELIALLAVARNRGALLRDRWLVIAVVVLTPPLISPDAIQGIRAFRAVRALRALRGLMLLGLALRHLRRALAKRRFHYVLVVAAAVMVVGAVLVYIFERDTNASIDSPGDAVWWAIVTATTVGYGDISPATWGGRVVAVVLMFVGIGVIGLFTGSVAGYFVEQETAPVSDVDARLARIEAQLAQLLDRHDEPMQAAQVDDANVRRLSGPAPDAGNDPSSRPRPR